jgi:hypothetical protein
MSLGFRQGEGCFVFGVYFGVHSGVHCRVHTRAQAGESPSNSEGCPCPLRKVRVRGRLGCVLHGLAWGR